MTKSIYIKPCIKWIKSSEKELLRISWRTATCKRKILYCGIQWTTSVTAICLYKNLKLRQSYHKYKTCQQCSNICVWAHTHTRQNIDSLLSSLTDPRVVFKSEWLSRPYASLCLLHFRHLNIHAKPEHLGHQDVHLAFKLVSYSYQV
jgi:hypothetical protein